MAAFLHHIGCPSCGSRDNRAVYKDGSEWCFGCRDYKSGSISPYVVDRDNSDDHSEECIILPHDASHDYRDPGLQWLLKYGLTIPELIKHGVYWSENRQQVLFEFRSEGVLRAYQARNFSPYAKSKCFNKWADGEFLPIYSTIPGQRTRQLVLVEDPISAIKVSRLSDSMPCLTSTLPTSKINALAGLYEAFLVWLDPDMFHQGQQIANKFGWLGKEARAIVTKEDPKFYSDIDIEDLTRM